MTGSMTNSRLPFFAATALTLFLVPATLYGQVFAAYASSPSVDPKKSDHSQRCLAAVDLAILAAESGVMDVSVEAMRRACQKGPPVASVDLGGGILGGGSRQRNYSSSNRNNDQQQKATAQAKLAKRLLSLHDIWIEKEVESAEAYEAWNDLVLPPGRPSDAFCYSTVATNVDSYSYSNVEFDPKLPKVIPCGAAALVHWARGAGKVEALRKDLAERQAFSGAVEAVTLIRVILAEDESTSMEDAEALCEELAGKTKLLVSDPNAALLFGHLWKVVERVGEESPARKKLIEAVLSATGSQKRWSNNPWLSYLVATNLSQSIESGDEAAFRQAATLSMTRYSSLGSGNSEYIASCEARMYATAAKRAFDKGHYKLGAMCLKSQGLTGGGSRYGSPRWSEVVDPTKPVMKGLLSMTPEERLDTVGELVWKLPMLGLRDASRWTPCNRLPKLFAASIQEPVPGNQVARQSDECYSLLRWVMRDSLAVGKQAEIEKQIAELESRGSDDAKLAKLVLSSVLEEPFDLSLLESKDEHGKLKLTPPMGEGGTAWRLDVAILRQALASDKYREAALAMFEERHAVATKRRQRTIVARLNRIKQEDVLKRDSTIATHQALRHWVVSEDTTRDAIRYGRGEPALWTSRGDGAWGHQCGTDNSYLMLRYPLSGDLTVTFRCKDGPYLEGGTALGGMGAELMPRGKRILLHVLGGRGNSSIKMEDIAPNEHNAYQLVCRDDQLSIKVDDKFETSLGKASNAFPFFAMWDVYYRTSTFDSLKLEGDITIPRSIAMLSPELQGWSARYKLRRLPALKVGAKPELPALDTESKSRPDWRCRDGVMQSVNHAEAIAKERAESDKQADKEKEPWVEKRRESVVHYLRPLCDGEQVSLEFYYEPGKFALAPSVGRIAMLLSEPDVGLHWLTCDLPQWTGIEKTNQLVDPKAEQVKPVLLKEKDWNKAVVRLEGGVVTLQLNGELVYRRKWEAEAGRRFGLFHDPSKHHVKVRNLEFSGDWPEKLPSDFFEQKQESTI